MTSSSSAASASTASMWECAVCTLHNGAGASVCAACDTPRPPVPTFAPPVLINAGTQRQLRPTGPNGEVLFHLIVKNLPGFATARDVASRLAAESDQFGVKKVVTRYYVEGSDDIKTGRAIELDSPSDKDNVKCQAFVEYHVCPGLEAFLKSRVGFGQDVFKGSLHDSSMRWVMLSVVVPYFASKKDATLCEFASKVCKKRNCRAVHFPAEWSRFPSSRQVAEVEEQAQAHHAAPTTANNNIERKQRVVEPNDVGMVKEDSSGNNNNGEKAAEDDLVVKQQREMLVLAERARSMKAKTDTLKKSTPNAAAKSPVTSAKLAWPATPPTTNRDPTTTKWQDHSKGNGNGEGVEDEIILSPGGVTAGEVVQAACDGCGEVSGFPRSLVLLSKSLRAGKKGGGARSDDHLYCESCMDRGVPKRACARCMILRFHDEFPEGNTAEDCMECAAVSAVLAEEDEEAEEDPVKDKKEEVGKPCLSRLHHLRFYFAPQVAISEDGMAKLFRDLLQAEVEWVTFGQSLTEGIVRMRRWDYDSMKRVIRGNAAPILGVTVYVDDMDCQARVEHLYLLMQQGVLQHDEFEALERFHRGGGVPVKEHRRG